MAEPLLVTGSQTIGPFFKYGLEWPGAEHVFPAGVAGKRIEVGGRVIDGAGEVIPDALIEIWQPDANGGFGGPVKGSCAGWGRIPTTPQGTYTFDTVFPGRVAGPNGEPQAPHLFVTVFARGLLRHLFTRMYFDGEAANASDPVLKAAGARAGTLVAKRAGDGKYTWDIVLQGANETVFLDV